MTELIIPAKPEANGQLLTAEQFVKKYSLGGDEGRVSVGDPRLLDYLTPQLLTTLVKDFHSLPSNSQSELGFAAYASLKKNQHNRLWRALVISSGGRVQMGASDFIFYLDEEDRNLVPAFRNNVGTNDKYTVISGQSRGRQLEFPSGNLLPDREEQSEDEVLILLLKESKKSGLKEPSKYKEVFQRYFKLEKVFGLLDRLDPRQTIDLIRLLLIAQNGFVVNPSNPKDIMYLRQEMGNQYGVGNLSVVHATFSTGLTVWRFPGAYSEIFGSDGDKQVIGADNSRVDNDLRQIIIKERVVIGPG